jgi:formylglycine-generating enzyme required for sulfatase activity
MHQETLSYMWHELPYDMKRRPLGYVTAGTGLGSGTRNQESVGRRDTAQVPAGEATLGTARGFAWDNEQPAHTVCVPAFQVDRCKVTNAEFLRYVEATGAPAPHFWTRADDGRWWWRGMFERVPLPLGWPVYVTWEEAAAYARWIGARLPTEAEFLRYAEGAAPGLCDFTRWDPLPVDRDPVAASAWGVDEPIGNGWEWTADVFRPFDGFVPIASYPEYSADFFDDAHYVMKGASPVTARSLTRPGFRNWFRPQYPYVYAGFRTVAGP